MSNKRVRLTLVSSVEVPVQAEMVVLAPADATDEELDAYANELAERAEEWIDGDNRAWYRVNGEVDDDEDEDEDEVSAVFVRRPDGRLGLASEEEQPKKPGEPAPF
jgi:hypothetical protein